LGDDFYTQNTATIKSASEALADLARCEILKQTPSDLLAVAKKMMDALDVVKGLHPFIGGVFLMCHCFSPSKQVICSGGDRFQGRRKP